MSTFYVYIISNWKHSVFYTGFSDDVEYRTFQHKKRFYKKAFSNRYNCYKLLYYEEWGTAEEALHREKQIKKYRRQWKINLINSMNPAWRDLYEDFLENL